ncbi:MAG: Cys-tRNA(Pro) deacylase [Bacillota bacterium]|nr:Cys-tRNA(Pro) deacylase [Bacillota bacterium]
MSKAKKEKDIKTNAMRFLDTHGIDYETVTYEADGFTDGVHLAKKLGIDPNITYKTLVTVGKSKNHFVFVLPVAAELHLKKAAKAVGEKSIEMIHVKDITALTGYVRGGCSPLGMKKQFPTVVHDAAETLAEFYVSGGRIGSQIKVNPRQLVEVIQGKFEDIITE